MKLPKVFANIIDKEINNNEDYFRGEINNINNYNDVSSLRKYFDRDGYANKLNVVLKTNNGDRVERLILWRNGYVVNINNEKIMLSDIKGYTIKK